MYREWSRWQPDRLGSREKRRKSELRVYRPDAPEEAPATTIFSTPIVITVFAFVIAATVVCGVMLTRH